jgi:hypothetical protein
MVYDILIHAAALALMGAVFYAGIVIGRALAPDPECKRRHRDEL